MFIKTLCRLSLFTAIATILTSTSNAQDWPQFLGPKADAKSEDSVPTEWSADKNLLWKYDMPGAGSSSPIIVDDRLFITSFSSEGDSITRHLSCINKKSGKKIWNKEFKADYREDGYRGYITEHGYASNTPVSDGKSLFVFFGKDGVYAFDLDGKQLWHKDVGKGSSSRRWGSASSLVLHKDKVIVNASEEANSIIAFDKKSGKEVWKQESDLLELAYGTPRIVPNGDKKDLVLSVPGEIWGLNPDSGKTRWFAETRLTGNVSPSVIVGDNTIYSFGGYRSSGSVAVGTGGEGDVSDSKQKWNTRNSSYVATPLLYKEKFYWIDDRGVAYSTSSKDGEVVYRERVRNLRGRPVYASPVLIGDHIYVVTRRSGTIVYKPGDKFEETARNAFEGDETDFNASPAVSDGKLYIRSNKALYCIGDQKKSDEKKQSPKDDADKNSAEKDDDGKDDEKDDAEKDDDGKVLSEKVFQKLHSELEPKNELWKTIPWQANLLDGQRKAAKTGKLMLIWAMDGHPLGCT